MSFMCGKKVLGVSFFGEKKSNSDAFQQSVSFITQQERVKTAVPEFSRILPLCSTNQTFALPPPTTLFIVELPLQLLT